MFTGLVEDVGTLEAVADLPSGKGRRLTVAAALLNEPVALGDSICISGVCLTAVSWHKGRAEFDAGPETLSRTTLSSLRKGAEVNLERALRLSDRLGGHLVAGHVDGTGRLATVAEHGEAWDVTIAIPPALSRYIVEKGSIAVDGISLTVNRAEQGSFAVSIIPHTQRRTALRKKTVGDPVNLEVDIIGKYVERLLSGYARGGAPTPTTAPGGGLDLDKLKEHGFAPSE